MAYMHAAPGLNLKFSNRSSPFLGAPGSVAPAQSWTARVGGHDTTSARLDGARHNLFCPPGIKDLSRPYAAFVLRSRYAPGLFGFCPNFGVCLLPEALPIAREERR